MLRKLNYRQRVPIMLIMAEIELQCGSTKYFVIILMIYDLFGESQMKNSLLLKFNVATQVHHYNLTSVIPNLFRDLIFTAVILQLSKKEILKQVQDDKRGQLQLL